jgi:hypothetical protein
MAAHSNSEENVDSNQFEFTPENYKEIEKILAKYPKNYKRYINLITNFKM